MCVASSFSWRALLYVAIWSEENIPLEPSVGIVFCLYFYCVSQSLVSLSPSVLLLIPLKLKSLSQKLCLSLHQIRFFFQTFSWKLCCSLLLSLVSLCVRVCLCACVCVCEYTELVFWFSVFPMNFNKCLCDKLKIKAMCIGSAHPHWNPVFLSNQTLTILVWFAKTSDFNTLKVKLNICFPSDYRRK